jgi:hypothetical protein
MLAMLAALVFGVGWTPVADSDLWWHMAAGREMVRTGGFLRVDPFSLGAAGRPWIDVHWLFQLAVHGMYQAGGLTALVIAKALLVAAGAVVLAFVVRAGLDREEPAARQVALPLLLVALPGALFLVRHLVLVRPVVLTMLFLALFMLVLERFRRDGRPRALIALPLIQVVWANCQGLFALGPALLASQLVGAGLARALGRPRELPEGGARWLGWTLLGCAAASLVTPYGGAVVLFPFKLLLRLTPASANVFSHNIAENVPPWVLERMAPGQMSHLAWYLAALAASFFVAAAWGRRVVFGRALAVLGFVGLALMANRNVLLLYWVATPVMVMNLAAPVAALLARARAATWAARAAVAGAVVALALLVVTAARRETAIAAPAPFRVPEGAARVIAEGPGGGRVFAADHYGGYLIWRLYPQARPYMDTRLVLRTADEYAEFLAVLDHPERFDALDARHRFEWAALPTAFPDRYLGLVQRLARAPGWRLVHTDGSEALFARDPGPGARRPAVDLGNGAVVDGIVAALGPVDGEVAGAARRHLARLALVLGHVDQARRVLAALPASDTEAQSLLGRCHLVTGDLAAAEAIGRRLLEAGGDDGPDALPGLTLLALVALERGDTRAGLHFLRRALSLDPFNAEARSILDRLEAGADGGGPP